MARHGSPRAYAPTDYRQELAAVSGFSGIEDFVLRCALQLGIDEFIGLALSSSHVPGSSSASAARAPGMRCAT
jgi:hypothetical protein